MKLTCIPSIVIMNLPTGHPKWSINRLFINIHGYYYSVKYNLLDMVEDKQSTR